MRSIYSKEKEHWKRGVVLRKFYFVEKHLVGSYGFSNSLRNTSFRAVFFGFVLGKK